LKTRILFTLLVISIFLNACQKIPTPQEYFAKAQNYQQQGAIKDAVISLKNALQAKPDYIEARILLGDIYLKSGNGVSAQKEFDQAIKFGASSPALVIKSANALLLQDKFNDVIAMEADISGMTPEQHLEWLRIRAESFLSINSPKSAEQVLTQAKALNISSRELALSEIKLQFARHDLQATQEKMAELLKQFPEFAEAWYFSALVNQTQKDFSAAKQALQKVVDLTDAELLPKLGFLAAINLIDLQINTKEYEQAKQNLDRIQKKTQTTHPIILYFAAFLAYHDKNYIVAKNILLDVTQKMPNMSQAYLLLGASQFALQEYESANINVEKFLNDVPGDVGARRLLAEIQLKQNRPIDALEVLSTLPDDQEKDERFLGMLARATLSSGDAASASRNLRELVQANPENIRLRTELVRALADLGEFDEAIDQIKSSKLGDREKVISEISLRMRQGKINIARNLIQAEIVKNKDPALITLAGLVELSDKKPQDAQRFFQQALSIDNAYAPALIYTARAALIDHDYETAQQQLNQVLTSQPKNWLAMFMMAHVANGQKQSPEQVMVWLERAHEANPSALAPASVLIKQAMLKGEKEKALRLSQQLVQVSNNNPNALVMLARVQVALGTANAAINTLKDLAKQFPTSSDPYHEMASIYIKQKNWRAAKEALERLLSLNSKDIAARVALIKVNLALNDISAARSQALVVKQGKYHPALIALIGGDIEASAGNWPAAVDRYQQALQAGENPQVVIKLANAYHQLKQDPVAIALLQKWHDKQSFSLISIILSEYLQKAGELPRAIKVLEELSVREAKNPVLWNNLAWLYLEAKNEKFLQAASTAYELNSQSYQIVDTYGWMLLQSGAKTEEALAMLTKANDMAGNVPSVKYHLALALQKSNRKAEAKMTLEQALSSQKPFPEKAQAADLLHQMN